MTVAEVLACYLLAGAFVVGAALDEQRTRAARARIVARWGWRGRLLRIVMGLVTWALWPLLLPALVRVLRYGPARPSPRPRPPWRT